MAIQSALSTQPLSLVAGDIRSQWVALAPKVVVYFGSTKYEHQDLAAAMQDAFPAALTIGCSTAGEIVSGRMLKQSVVALGLDGEEIEDAAVAVVETLSAGPRVAEAFQQFETHFQTPMQSLDLARFVGVVLVDGLCRSEEQLMDALGNLTDVIFVGGAAGDDLLFRRTFVSACGKAFPDAAVLLLLKVKKGFDIIKTQSFRALDKKLVATKVDEAQRRVDQFNHQPAAQAYADALGIPVAAIADFARQHPLGLMVAGEPYVRSPQQVQGESLVFYCNIKEGMELRLLASTDIVADTEKALAAKARALGPIAGLLDFDCILRTLELEQENRGGPYGALFHGIPTAGFSTYGEEYMGHINQTATMLVFK